MSNKNIRFSLKYTLTGFSIGLIISIISLLISVKSGDIIFNIEALSLFFSEHIIVTFLIFTPIFLTSVIGYITDINFYNLLKSSEFEIKDIKEQSQKIYTFIETLRKGESIQKLKEQFEEDQIIKSLINLSEEIEKRQEAEEIRKKEDAQRAKTSEGLAYFGAVLRQHNNTIEELTQAVTNELVKYIDAYQAAFYLIEEKEGKKIIKEVANYAQGRKRFAAKELEWGESLPGACIIEKKTNYIKNISEDYLEIESGLGHSKPKSLILIPVVTQEGVVHGAIELASFKIYEDYEINFIEQVAENTAMTISSLKINEETAILLKESREQAQALSSREDELQRTISEMRRLQENADIQSIAFRSYQDATNKALIRAEFSNDGKLLFANKKFLQLFEYKSNSEIENSDISKFASPDNQEWFDDLKDRVINKSSHYEGLMKHLTKSGKILWIESSYIGLKNEKGKNEKILFLGIDATEIQNNILNLDLKLKLINETLFSIDFQTDGNILNIGTTLSEKLAYKENEIISKPVTEIFSEKFNTNFTNILNRILNSGNAYEGEMEFVNKSGEINYFYGTIFPEKDIYDNINFIKILAFDYSQQIDFANKIKEQEHIISELQKEVNATKERMNRHIEQVRAEMKELYLNIETAYLFSKQMLEKFPDAVISIDKDNQIEFINSKAAELFNIEPEKIAGKATSELFPDNQAIKNDNYLGKILNIDNTELPLQKETEVFITNDKGEKIKLNMILIKSEIGLRKQLTAFLKK